MDPQTNSAPASGADAGAAEGRLPLVMTVGFTGHRVIEHPAEAERLVGEVLTAISGAFAAVGRTQAAAFDGPARLRLLIGAAPGTDRIVAAAWRSQELGPSHLIYPFREPGGLAAYTDDPRKADAETRVETPPEGEAWTGLDSASLGLEHDQAHAEVSRWIVRHADLLVAWWNGESIHGAGGTGDTLRRALEAGLPVIWIAPGEPHPRLVDPARLRHHAEAAEAMAHLAAIAEPLDPHRLAGLLAAALTAPGHGADDAEEKARRDYAQVDPLRRQPAPIGWVQALLDHTLWRAFAWFETIAGGARGPARRGDATPPSLTA